MTPEPQSERRVSVELNGDTYELTVESRRLLVHFIRDDCGLTGTHVGCDTGNCGACTVLWDGLLVKSCMVLAAQVDGGTVRTAASLTEADGKLNCLQQCFSEHHALQCGYCTSGMLMTATDLLDSGEEIHRAVGAPRAPGQHLPLHWLPHIVKAIRAAAGQDVERHH